MSRSIRIFLDFVLPSILLLCAGMVSAGIVDFSPGLLKYVEGKWGQDAVERLHDWRTTELEGIANHPKSQPELSLDELNFFNRFWNKVPFYTDQEHWGVEDYWATPIEMLASDGGDCEDYSIAKYFSLKELGVPAGSLRITYVRALKFNEAHMVLAYYPTPNADPFILDNLNGKVLRASDRADLEPVYSFNDDDLWTAGTSGFMGKSSQIRMWGQVLDKMKKERQM